MTNQPSGAVCHVIGIVLGWKFESFRSSCSHPPMYHESFAPVYYLKELVWSYSREAESEPVLALQDSSKLEGAWRWHPLPCFSWLSVQKWDREIAAFAISDRWSDTLCFSTSCCLLQLFDLGSTFTHSFCFKLPHVPLPRQQDVTWFETPRDLVASDSAPQSFNLTTSSPVDIALSIELYVVVQHLHHFT